MGKRPYRVLQILTAMNRGGAETMVMNHYRALDRSIIQFDFLVHRQQRGDYDDEIEALGGRIFRAPAIRPWSYLSYFHWLNKFFRTYGEKYIAVHGHIQENTGFALYFAKKYGIANRVASSHIADLGIDYKYPFRQFGKLWTNAFATDRLACGTEAGKFLYRNREFSILKNAIDTQKFLYNQSVRVEVRACLKLKENTFVIGNVARFCPQKNHEFILRTFAKFIQSKPNSHLILVGEGPLLEKNKALAIDLGISERVSFLGLRDDISDLLQAFDLFFMPSLFEGLPVSVIEAQATGLPCVLSDTIDPETDITGNVTFISLSAPTEVWVEALLNARKHERKNTASDIITAGYDVQTNLGKLLNLYGINQ